MIDVERLAAVRTIDFTCLGRRTGRPLRLEIWWFHVDGRFIITGTPGRRHWYANVLANPTITVHAAGADLAATARPVTDLELRRRVFTDVQTRWYRDQAPLDELIATAPMIEITFI